MDTVRGWVVVLILLLSGIDYAEAAWGITISDGDTHVNADWDNRQQCEYWAREIERTELHVTGCYLIEEDYYVIEVYTKGADGS